MSAHPDPDPDLPPTAEADLDAARRWMRWRMKAAFDDGAPTRWFEELYARAGGDAAVVPWADRRPHPLLVRWIAERFAPRGGDGGAGGDGDGDGAPARGFGEGHARAEGRAAVVVGAGLGDDVAPLVAAGWRVTAFDIAPSAIEWARRRWAEIAPPGAPPDAVAWRVADLLDLPADLVGAFDLAVEIYTFQALPPALRDDVAAGLRRLLRPGGELLFIARAPRDPEPGEPPPWPVAPADLMRHLCDAGHFEPLAPPSLLPDPDAPTLPRLLAHLRAV